MVEGLIGSSSSLAFLNYFGDNFDGFFSSLLAGSNSSFRVGDLLESDVLGCFDPNKRDGLECTKNAELFLFPMLSSRNFFVPWEEAATFIFFLLNWCSIPSHQSAPNRFKRKKKRSWKLSRRIFILLSRPNGVLLLKHQIECKNAKERMICGKALFFKSDVSF